MSENPCFDLTIITIITIITARSLHHHAPSCLFLPLNPFYPGSVWAMIVAVDPLLFYRAVLCCSVWCSPCPVQHSSSGGGVCAICIVFLAATHGQRLLLLLAAPPARWHLPPNPQPTFPHPTSVYFIFYFFILSPPFTSLTARYKPTYPSPPFLPPYPTCSSLISSPLHHHDLSAAGSAQS